MSLRLRRRIRQKGPIGAQLTMPGPIYPAEPNGESIVSIYIHIHNGCSALYIRNEPSPRLLGPLTNLLIGIIHFYNTLLNNCIYFIYAYLLLFMLTIFSINCLFTVIRLLPPSIWRPSNDHVCM